MNDDTCHYMREFSRSQASKTNLRCENKEHPRASEKILETLVGVQSLGLKNVMRYIPRYECYSTIFKID